jgi:ubiquinone biosynthesis protein COQ4
MQSPELDPKLVEGLLTSLAEWDFRASVPFAHLFMEHGESDAMQGYDDLALNHPLADQMLKDRYLSPRPDLEFLAGLPEGSLGKAYERYYTENKLEPDLLRESAFIDAHKKRGEDVGYLAERGFQLHDLFHVLTGFDTSPLGEVRVVSFTVAQVPAPYPAMIIATRPLQAALYRPAILPFLMDAITEGWSLGRKAKSLMPVHWEEYWESPLSEIQAEYDLA